MRYLTWILPVLFLAACSVSPQTGDSGLLSANEDIKGRYTLVAVDGAEIPATITHGVVMTVHSGLFTIRADGTCTSKTVFQPSGRNAMTRKVNATYTRDGSRLLMKWQGAGMTTGTVEGDTFTMNNEGMIFTYRK